MSRQVGHCAFGLSWMAYKCQAPVEFRDDTEINSGYAD